VVAGRRSWLRLQKRVVGHMQGEHGHADLEHDALAPPGSGRHGDRFVLGDVHDVCLLEASTATDEPPARPRFAGPVCRYDVLSAEGLGQARGSGGSGLPADHTHLVRPDATWV
jgi:hypothetical protein